MGGIVRLMSSPPPPLSPPPSLPPSTQMLEDRQRRSSIARSALWVSSLHRSFSSERYRTRRNWVVDNGVTTTVLCFFGGISSTLFCLDRSATSRRLKSNSGFSSTVPPGNFLSLIHLLVITNHQGWRFQIFYCRVLFCSSLEGIL